MCKGPEKGFPESQCHGLGYGLLEHVGAKQQHRTYCLQLLVSGTVSDALFLVRRDARHVPALGRCTRALHRALV